MPAYLFTDPAPAYRDTLALKNAAGGTIAFYERGTTTPKDTFSDPDLSTPNTNPVQLDSAGRTNVAVFLDGEYTVVLKDASGITIWTRDVIPLAGAGATIPPPTAGYFLTSPDGVSLAWVQLFLLPDPGDGVNQVPVTIGGGVIVWKDLPVAPVAPDPEIVVDVPKKSFQAGVSTDTKKYLRQFGTDSAPASGLYTTTKAILFDKPFLDAPVVMITPITSSQPSGPTVGYLAAAPSATGFSASFDVAEGAGGSSTILNAVPFGWTADGFVNVEPADGGDDDPIPGDGGL